MKKICIYFDDLALPASNVFFYRADVTSPSELADTAAEIRKQHGDPTILINNAGVGSGGSILDKSEAQIRKIFEVNTISHWWTVKEFLPAMIKKNRGHVVTMAYVFHFCSGFSLDVVG
jgi:NAD(P)-dependent dehydrogenase (short-subunit alcohol dehydrogenase family)